MADVPAESSVGKAADRESAAERPSGVASSAQNESALFSGDSVLNILKLIFAGAPLPEVLTIITQLVEGQGNGMLCTVFLLDSDGEHVRCAAAPSLPNFIGNIGRIPVGPKAASCGTAIYRREPVYVADILVSPLWEKYRHLLQPYGLRAVWARPLLSRDGRILGTFASYYREVRSPGPTELQLIENASQIAGIAIERHLHEEDLRRSEARNAAILDSALDCIVTIDHDGCITEFNPAAERTFGYRRDEVIGKQLAEAIIPPALRGAHRHGLAQYLAGGEARVLGRRIEMTAVRADGSEFPVELAITRIPLEGPPSFTGYLRDITDRKKAEADLQRSAAYLAEAQRLSRTGSFGWNLVADDHYWSDETFRIFEYDPSTKVALRSILDRAHPQDLHLVKSAIALAGSGSDFDYECRFVMPTGCVKRLHIVAHCVRHDRPEYIGAVQDVTERRLSEEALGKVRSELAHMARVTSLGALTASIAHEVNQPLSGIITNASTCLRMLAADPPNVDGALETARRTIRDGNRASEVITRLRALFSKKEASTEPVDLNEATREVIALSLSDLQRNRVVLRPELADNLAPVMGDRIQLQQVVLNLLRNASDAMSAVDDRPRQLVVRTEQDDDSVRLTVRDVGSGIDHQNVDRLFDPFYTTKSAGMGMGLSVSRSIIEGHHGRLWAAPNDGPGTTFAFVVPRAPKGVTSASSLGAIQKSALDGTQSPMRNS